MSSTETATRLDVPRHLQDFNGYCGPACALMVVDFAGSKKSPPVFAQNEFFREVRSHAKQASDRRPIKSPAESLVTLINNHAAGKTPWKKIYHEDSLPVAEALLQAVDGDQQPCLLMVNRGMHWVVGFGMLKKPDGSPSGLLMRDPAWAGMPRFYGLSVFPDKPAIEHCAAPCTCLEHTESKTNKRTGKVHERFFTIEELLSHRGLQGSLDWEGDGAIALVPEGTQPAAARIPGTVAAGVGAALIPVANAREQAGEAALKAVRESGLTGRPDSPPEWDKALTGAQPGEPILVKDPVDLRDDFFLVPLTPADPKAPKGAWAMVDARTLALREVSLLEDWQAPVLPNHEDTQQASQNSVVLADGTVAKFKPSDLTPNTKNLVWQPSAAAVLPYWPVKEFTAPHPVTGQPTPIYQTQDGKTHGHLGPDESGPDPQPQPSKGKISKKPKSPKKSRPLEKLALPAGLAAVSMGAYLYFFTDTFDDFLGDDGDNGGRGNPITSGNLLKNPGFEKTDELLGLGTVVKSFPTYQGKWGTEAGTSDGRSGGVSPMGSRMLAMKKNVGVTSQTFQFTSAADFSDAINSGKATFKANADFNIASGGIGASGAIVIHFYPGGWGNEMPAISKSLSLDGNPNTWQKIELTGNIPPNTKWIGTEVLYSNASLKASPGYVDNANLTITTQ